MSHRLRGLQLCWAPSWSLVEMSSSWNFPAWASPSYEGSEPSQAGVLQFSSWNRADKTDNMYVKKSQIVYKFPNFAPVSWFQFISWSFIWIYIAQNKEFFRTCNVLPFSCTHLALWIQRQGKRPKVHAKQKGFKNFFSKKGVFRVEWYDLAALIW